MVRAGLWFGLLACCAFLACATVNPNAKLDPLVEQISIQAAAKKTPGTAPPKPPGDIVLEEIPLKTPLTQARAIMRRHGFACWSGVPDNGGPCLYCAAYIRKNQCYADRIVVKFFHEHERVTNVVVVVERDVFKVF
jgi:hypothetical protein